MYRPFFLSDKRFGKMTSSRCVTCFFEDRRYVRLAAAMLGRVPRLVLTGLLGLDTSTLSGPFFFAKTTFSMLCLIVCENKSRPSFPSGASRRGEELGPSSPAGARLEKRARSSSSSFYVLQKAISKSAPLRVSRDHYIHTHTHTLTHAHTTHVFFAVGRVTPFMIV